MATVTSDSVERLRVATIETHRLRLRPWSERDVEAYAEIIGDPDVVHYLGSGRRYRLKRVAAAIVARFSRLEARRAIRSLNAHWARHGYGEWAVEEKATGRLVGQVGLHYHGDWVAEPTKTEVGWLFARDAWGRGYATEAAAASLVHAFDRLELDRLVSIALIGNERSIRVMERIGLARAGETHWRGSDVVWYALERDEWERQRAAAGNGAAT
ncbi:MAG: hypothetical protein QOE36_1322 [Gaiellaceae bacterium]|jgi:RimJ/RimL family protein N-acetyltransferase|nr:hypothetical protein [Gaiellaceae bacterium]